MLSAGSETADVYLGETEVGISHRRGKNLVTRWIVGKTSVESWRAALKILSEGGGRRRVNLWISGSLARPFLFEAVDGLRNVAEAANVASSLALDATGLVGPTVVWLNDWRPGRTCVAVAMSLELREEIEQLAKQSRVRLSGLRPWWAVVLEATASVHQSGAATLAVSDTDSLTLLSGNSDITDALSYVPVPSNEEMEAVLSRHSLATGIHRQGIIYVSLSQLEAHEGSVEASARGRVPFASYEPPRP